MSWRIATRHTSIYRYSAPVVASFNEARIAPTPSGGQTVIEASISVTPATPVFTYRDYFGTLVAAFDVPEPHDELVVVGSSIVDTAPERHADRGFEWRDLTDASIVDQFSEYLAFTPYTTRDAELAAVARDLCDAGSPAEAAEAVSQRIRGELTYESGVTGVSTSASEAWRERRGVCQDFAHVALVMLRDLGIPARYISGYLHPQVDAGIGEPAVGQGHAWIEYWLGEWYAIDPTHGDAVSDRHVTVAHGRDYGDVAPFRGVYQGGRLEQLDVTVELVRTH